MEKKFEFTKENLKLANKQFSKYPKGREKSAIKALLYLAQEQNDGWISLDGMNYIADFLSIAPIKVYEVATFYTMFNVKPVGKYVIKICKTTPCMLRGADDLVDYCKKKLNIEINQTTLDKIFTIKTVQCLGACVNAPVVQINDDYYEDLSIEKFEEILTAMHYGMSSKVGSQIGRKSSEPFDYEIGN